MPPLRCILGPLGYASAALLGLGCLLAVIGLVSVIAITTWRVTGSHEPLVVQPVEIQEWKGY